MKAKRTITVVLLISLLAGIASFLIACGGPKYDFEEIGTLSTKIITKELDKDNNYLVAEFSNDGIYRFTTSPADAINTSTIKVYRNDDLTGEITPIIEKGVNGYDGTAKYYRFNQDDNTMAIDKVYIHFDATKDGITFKAKYNKDALDQNSELLEKEKAQMLDSNNKKSEVTIVKSYAWLSQYRQIKGLDFTSYAYGATGSKNGVKVHNAMNVYDSIIYLNRIDTQLLYGLIRYLKSDEVVKEFKNAAIDALNTMITNPGETKSKIDNFIRYYNSYKNTLWSYAFNKTSAKFASKLEEKGEKLLIDTIKSYAPVRLLNGLFGSIVNTIIEKGAKKVVEIPALKITHDSFDRVINFIEDKFKTEIDKNKNQTNSYTCFSKGIVMKTATYYSSNTNRNIVATYYDQPIKMEVWNDEASKSYKMTGAEGQKGFMNSKDKSFILLSDLGGVNVGYKLIANRGALTLEY